MAKILELRLLGRLDLQWNGTPVADIQASKTLALLSYLAVTSRSHTRPALAGLLWGGMPEAKARDNLSKALSTLRRVVGEHLTITRQKVAFNEESDFWLDVTEFETGVSDHSIERLQVAVQLYEGDFLDGFYVRNAPEFEDWMLAQQSRLKELALRALHTLAAHFAEQDDTGRAQAVDYTRRLLALEPWREEAHRQMMRLLALTGQRGAALAQYETCRQVLADELGVEPGPETMALYEQIRAGELSREAEGQDKNRGAGEQYLIQNRPNLPPQPTLFIGREDELAEITQRLADPDCRLLTLVGPGGIGKTRLAIQATKQAVANSSGVFPGGIYFVPLAALNSSDFLVSAIAEPLSFTFQGNADPKVQLLGFLGQMKQAMLLVLDNFEQLIEGADLLAALLQRAPAVKLLVTSRERLNLRDEWLLDIQGLPFPETNQNQTSKVADADTRETFEVGQGNYSALQLFEQRARQVQADFDLTTDYLAVSRICQLVEGMPLGLELAAAWVRLLTCQEIAREIEKSLEFLTTSLRDVPARHRSLAAVFDHSWNHLSSEEQRVFRSLAVFRGGFSHEAAEQVAGASLPLLAALVDKSMLRRNASGRYELHELLRQYGAEKLDEAGETEQTQDRHLAFFLKLAEEVEPHLAGSEQINWLPQLDLEYDNLRAALDWSRTAEGTAEFGLRLAGSLTIFWDRRSHFSEGVAYLLAALSNPETQERTATRAKALHRIAGLAFELGDFTRVRAWLEESQAINRELGPAGKSELAHALIMLGVIDAEEGNFVAAISLQQEALVILREMKDSIGTARALRMLGWCALRMGAYEQATDYFTEALPITRQIGERFNEAQALSGLGETVLRQGDTERATRFLEAALLLNREVGSKWGIAALLGSLGWVALLQGNLWRAVTLLKESLILRQEIGDRAGGIAWCLEKLAQVALLSGQQELSSRREAEFRQSAQLFGAAEALRISSSSPMDLADQPEYERQLAIVRAQLDEVTLAAAWAQGRAMSLEQATNYALAANTDKSDF